MVIVPSCGVFSSTFRSLKLLENKYFDRRDFDKVLMVIMPVYIKKGQ